MSDEISSGSLIIKVSTATGAIPIEGATVVIQGIDENNQDVLFSLLTDRDGLTPKIVLPAPLRSLSQSPNPLSKPYATYNIEVYKDGFYQQHYNGVPIFQGVTAVQNAQIIPISEFDAPNQYYAGGQIFEEYENPDL